MLAKSSRGAKQTEVLALLAILVVAAGCTSWSKTAMPPQADAWQSVPSMVRVQLKDGRELTLEHARVVGDSLIGDLKAPSKRGHEPAEQGRVAVALADIQKVEKNRFNIATTALTLVIIVGLLWGLVALSVEDATF